METLQGVKVADSFDPKLIADFHYIWQETFHKKWDPVFRHDMHLDSEYDFFKTIVMRVKKFNESYDMTIVGDRGLGKSAFAVGAASSLHKYFTNDKTSKLPVDQICFSIEEWVAVTSRMKSPGVVLLDEVGIEGSLSSRTSMKKENRTTSDIIQLMRTDRIITIYISVDRDRIDKRVRQLTSVMGTPIRKLSDEDTNGYGLAIEADIKYRRTSPAGNKVRNKKSENDSGYLQHVVSHVNFAPKGRINSIIVPHPDVELWNEYGKKRDIKLQDVKAAGLIAQQDDIPKGLM
jgi:hypothetical protein